MATVTITAPEHVTPEKVMRYAWGYAPPLIIEAAVHNRVFDALSEGPLTVAEVAGSTGASERGLTSIMNALTGLELLAKDGDRYALTPESGAFLVSTKPSYLGGMMAHMSSQLIPKWLDIENIVRTGRPSAQVNDAVEGSAFFEKFVSALFPFSQNGATNRQIAG